MNRHLAVAFSGLIIYTGFFVIAILQDQKLLATVWLFIMGMDCLVIWNNSKP